MTVSAAKLEANRRNARKSTGPRTDAGKNRSSRNALDHGCRSNIPVMPNEDPQALEDRRDAWNQCLLPRDPVEQGFVDDAVAYKWQQDRARRAQVARLSANINHAGVEEARREADEVLCFGQRLFCDHRAPLAVFPHLDREKAEHPSKTVLVSHSNIVKDPQDPQRLVLHLQASAGGCQWLLDQWAELRSILKEGRLWQSPDKLKAVRMLGRHPIEAADDREVLRLFVACQTMEGRSDLNFPEINNELYAYQRKYYAERLAGRDIETLRPNDAAAALEILLDIVDRARARIEVKAEAHRRRAEVDAALAVDRLSFDDTAPGERLRRYELASGRALTRSLDSLLKIRRADLGSGPLCVVSGPLPFIAAAVEVPDAPAPYQPEAQASEPAGQPPTDGSDPYPPGAQKMEPAEQLPTDGSVPYAPDPQAIEPAGQPPGASQDRFPLLARRVGTGCDAPDDADWGQFQCPDRPGTPNEPGDACEYGTNEPIDAGENAPNEPTDGCAAAASKPEGATCCDDVGALWNEPTDAGENAPNEPTAGFAAPAPEGCDDVGALQNEPTDSRENAPDEPTAGLAALAASARTEAACGEERISPNEQIRAAAVVRGHRVGPPASERDAWGEDIDGDFNKRAQARMRIAEQEQFAKQMMIRAENLRRIEYESRKAAEDAELAHRARRPGL
jgi:hypothetical protein